MNSPAVPSTSRARALRRRQHRVALLMVIAGLAIAAITVFVAVQQLTWPDSGSEFVTVADDSDDEVAVEPTSR